MAKVSDKSVVEQAIEKKGVDSIRDLTQYDLSTKQILFIYKYIEHAGNGTAAAHEVYVCKNDNVASSQASALLRIPKVREALRHYLLNFDATPESAISTVNRERFKANKSADRQRAAETILKIHGVLSNGSGNQKPVANTVVNVNIPEKIQTKIHSITDVDIIDIAKSAEVSGEKD